MYQVEWTKRAIRELKKIAEPDQSKLYHAAGKLNAYPSLSGLAQVKGTAMQRIRVGSYRIIFTANEIVEIITIEHVRKRNERTYRNL